MNKERLIAGELAEAQEKARLHEKGREEAIPYRKALDQLSEMILEKVPVELRDKKMDELRINKKDQTVKASDQSHETNSALLRHLLDEVEYTTGGRTKSVVSNMFDYKLLREMTVNEVLQEIEKNKSHLIKEV